MSDTLKTQTQEEHVLISTSLEVEKLDTFLFRSPVSALYKPRRARGVFGGQVISQAVTSATRSVNEKYSLHVCLSPSSYWVHVLMSDRIVTSCSFYQESRQVPVTDYPGQCYFMLSASTQIPILYHVEVLRTGRTYSTCSVKAVQDGRTIFMLLCSFAVPEPRVWAHTIAAPLNVPSPEECPLEEETLAKVLAETTDPKLRQSLELQIMVTSLNDF